MKVISVENVSKSFEIGEEVTPVLKDLNFFVNKSEFLSIMGPSGCGKSTLLYLLGGLDHPSRGKVILNNTDLSTLKEKQKSIRRKREVGFVFQFYNLIPNLNVEDNIMLPLLLDGKNINSYKNKLNDLLDIIGLKYKAKSTPIELSGGEQQRVAIARALIFEPQIILLDEPIGNLDSKTGNGIMTLFKTINQDLGKTLVQVTHSYDAAKFGTNLIELKDGEIISQIRKGVNWEWPAFTTQI